LLCCFRNKRGIVFEDIRTDDCRSLGVPTHAKLTTAGKLFSRGQDWRIITVGDDGSVRVTDILLGKKHPRLVAASAERAHEKKCVDVKSLSGEFGSIVLCGCKEGIVTVYRLTPLDQLYHMTDVLPVNAQTISTDAEFRITSILIVGSTDDDVHFLFGTSMGDIGLSSLRISSRECTLSVLRRSHHRGPVFSVALANGHIFTASSDGSVSAWSAGLDFIGAVVGLHCSGINDITAHATGCDVSGGCNTFRLFTCGDDGFVSMADIDVCSSSISLVRKTSIHAHWAAVVGIAYSHRLSRVLSVGKDMRLVAHNLVSSEMIRDREMKVDISDISAFSFAENHDLSGFLVLGAGMLLVTADAPSAKARSGATM
jgi:hypothetical protein